MAATVSINGDEEPWTPPPLLLPVGDGVDPMDLLPFIGKEGNALYLMGNTRVEFPSDLYPPSWDERFVLQNAITEAGKASKRKLIVQQTRSVGVDHVFRIACYKNRTKTYRDRATKERALANADNRYNEGIKRDRVTNKNLRHDSSEFPSCSGASDAMRVETKRSRVSIAVYPFGA